jgi:hypothetical protein
LIFAFFRSRGLDFHFPIVVMMDAFFRTRGLDFYFPIVVMMDAFFRIRGHIPGDLFVD